jgi:hypothetical protein
MQTFRLLLGIAALWLATGAPAIHAETRHPESIATGIIVETDFAAGTIIIEGYRYRIAPDIEVQIAGSHGAVTMLRPGMKVQFRFLRVPRAMRELVEVREIPQHVEIQRL